MDIANSSVIIPEEKILERKVKCMIISLLSQSHEIMYRYKLRSMNAKKCFYIFSFGMIILGFGIQGFCQSTKNEKSYQGKPFIDSKYKGGAQVLPGKLQCECYDLGGEGVAFHDTDSINSGSGKLNPADGSYLHEFRMNEAVDISYTKFQDPPIDNNAFNLVEPEKDQLYVGWTKPGEWTKYTVNVTEAGTYQLGLMFTSNKNGKISIAVNDKDATGLITIPSTANEKETVPWRNWHHWNSLDNMAQIELKKGIQTITLHTEELGDMNYDYINFKKIK